MNPNATPTPATTPPATDKAPGLVNVTLIKDALPPAAAAPQPTKVKSE